MRNLRSFSLSTLAVAMLGSAALLGSTALTAQTASPSVRIVSRIDESQLVTLKGNTHPAANAKNDLGPVSSNLPMTDLILVLSRTPEQQAAFDAYVASEYDQNSPNFHHWLTPDQVGAQYGASDTDIATISNWLTGHGFTVDEVTKDHLSIRFSGTAGLVQSAFHTEIHNLSVRGVAHIANMTDPQIPAALAPAIVGIKALHNFFPRPLHHVGSAAVKDSATGKWSRVANSRVTSSTAARSLIAPSSKNAGAAPAAATLPQFSISPSGYLVEDVAPYDFATIYNILPLWTASTPIDGTGQTIAIAGTSDIDVGQTGEIQPGQSGANGNNDVGTFRNFFGLPTGNAANTPIRISGNSEPLTVCTDTTGNYPYPSNPCGQDDLLENSLDVQWSGSIAKNAQIILVSSYPASVSDDNLYDSESYIVNHLTAHVMNVSYGECELANGTAGNVEYYDLWQQAAAEGIAVFVAAGDSGSASCDDGGDDGGSNLPYPAESGLSVSGLASTPWNTAVGGTDFNWCSLVTSSNTECTAAPYWSTTNSANANAPESSALGYVPEVPWNDTCTSSLATAWMVQFFSGSPYINNNNSNVNVTDAETGCNAFVYYAQDLYDSGDGSLLYLVDTIGGSGGASGCVVGTPVTNTTTGEITGCSVGATSTGATTNPDTSASQASLTLVNNGWPQPSWQTGVTGIPSDGVRHIPDMAFFASDGFLSSSAYLVCVSDITTCSYSEKTEPIFLEVGGTSVATPAMAGVMGLVNQKTGAAQGFANPELYKLAASQTYSNCSAENVTNSSNCYFNDIDTGTNAMACDYDAYVTTPSPNCSLVHSGDFVGILGGYSAGAGYDQATGLGSLNVTNVVNAWTAAIGTSGATVTFGTLPSTIPSSETLAVTVTVASTTSGGGATPTGSVTLNSGSYSSGAQTLNGSGSFTFIIPGGTLSLGSDTLTAAYGGDSNYAATSNTAMLTVTAAAGLIPTVTVSPASTSLNSNASLSVPVTVSGSGTTPTGTVTLTSGSYNSGLQTLSSGAYTFTIPASALASGANTLTATYFGDSNYVTATGQATVTVIASSFTLTVPATATPSSIAPGASASEAITVGSTAGYSGTVTLTCQETDPSPSTGDGASCTTTGSGAVSLTGNGTSGTVTFTIGTTPVGGVASLVYPNIHGRGAGGPAGWVGAGGGVVVAFLVFLGIPARRRNWRAMVGMVALLAVLGAMSACGGASTNSGSGSTDPGTAAGTYTFKVVATGTPSVNVSPATFTVVVN